MQNAMLAARRLAGSGSRQRSESRNWRRISWRQYRHGEEKRMARRRKWQQPGWQKHNERKLKETGDETAAKKAAEINRWKKAESGVLSVSAAIWPSLRKRK
jgi:hypothetical protein